MEWVIGGVVGLVFGALALFGERWSIALADRRLRRHTCPTPCLESIRCRCGCEGIPGGEEQRACAVCGTEIVRDEESDTTHEMPAPKGFTSWGWERDREFRRHMRGGEWK